MRPLARSAGLMVWLVGVVAAQTVFVENAASGPGVTGAFLVGDFGYVIQLPPSPYNAVFGPNVVAPGMLAVINTGPTAAPVRIWIRPSGSDTPIRAEVISSGSVQTTFRGAAKHAAGQGRGRIPEPSGSRPDGPT